MRQSRKRQRACGLIPIRRPVGAWEVDRKRWPKGLREATDFLHSHGVKAITWFEPERVAGGTWLAENHPEWIMGGAGGGILKIGEPECRKWITNRVDKVLTDEGLRVTLADRPGAAVFTYRRMK